MKTKQKWPVAILLSLIIALVSCAPQDEEPLPVVVPPVVEPPVVVPPVEEPPAEELDSTIIAFKNLEIEEAQKLVTGRWGSVREYGGWAVDEDIPYLYFEFSTDTFRVISEYTTPPQTRVEIEILNWEKTEDGILLTLSSEYHSDNFVLYRLQNDTLYFYPDYHELIYDAVTGWRVVRVQDAPPRTSKFMLSNMYKNRGSKVHRMELYLSL
jgi:hypothetical protein